MGTSWLDLSRHPLHILSLPAEYTYEELDKQMNFLCSEYRRFTREHPQERHAMLIDISRRNQSHPKSRKRIADALGELSGLLRTRGIAQAYVTDNLVVRAALTAVSWLQTVPWPTQVFSTRAQAEKWLYERIAQDQQRASMY